MLSQPRSVVASGDIDGLVSATMLASVTRSWNVVAFSMQSSQWLVHPSLTSDGNPRADLFAGQAEKHPGDLFGVDLFSVQFDNVSNHVVEYGTKKLQNPEVRAAFNDWDEAVREAATTRLLAVPGIWANTQGGQESLDTPTSSRYKYPFGTAQILLAMLEASGHPPKFFDRTYLPWLVANCDGGVSTYSKYAANARVWWPVMAGAVGPGSLTEQIYSMVDSMRPHDFLDAVHRLDRERQASNLDPWLNDDWNLKGQSVQVLQQTLRWLTELTGWRDPVHGGLESLGTWVTVPLVSSAQVYYATPPTEKQVKNNPATVVGAKADPTLAAALIRAAATAYNANFFHGGPTGSRFNWVGGW